MHIAACISNSKTNSCFLQLTKLYQERQQTKLFCYFYKNSIELLCDFTPGKYDAIFLDTFECRQISEEIRQKDLRIRLIGIAPARMDIPHQEGLDLWFCLSEPLDALFLFPVLDQLAADIQTTDENGLLLKTRGILNYLVFSDIEYVEVMGRTVYFHLLDNKTEEIPGSIHDFEERLLKWPDFMKIHRSYIINLKHIQKLTRDGILTRSGHSVPISKHLYPQFKKDYLCHMMSPSQEIAASVLVKAPASSTENKGYRILLIDDEESERLRWSKALIKKDCAVYTADCPHTAISLAELEPFDCIVLDVDLGNESGFDLCQILQEKTGAPIVFLSSLSDSDHQATGFLAGGTDYITKDTCEELFWLKVKSRVETSQTGRTEFSCSGLSLNLAVRQASLQGQPLSLTTVEFDLLCLLMQNPLAIYSPSKLYEMIWGNSQWDEGHAIQMHISQLDRKLKAICNNHSFIESVWGMGYRFVPYP